MVSVFDNETNLKLEFPIGNFTMQEFSFTTPEPPSVVESARACREMTDWLIAHHPELLNSADPLPQEDEVLSREAVFEVCDRKRIEIGKALNEARMKDGISIRALATLADLSKNNVVRILEGRYNYTIDNLFRVAMALGMDIKIS